MSDHIGVMIDGVAEGVVEGELLVRVTLSPSVLPAGIRVLFVIRDADPASSTTPSASFGGCSSDDEVAAASTDANDQAVSPLIYVCDWVYAGEGDNTYGDTYDVEVYWDADGDEEFDPRVDVLLDTVTFTVIET